MSVSADTLQLLIGAGLAGERLVAVVRSIEADNGPSQSSGAKRQRRYRERQKARCDVTGDVTPLHNGSDAAPSLDKEAPQTPKEINPIPCVRVAREDRYHRLPEGWTPTRQLPVKTQAKVDQWPPGAVDDELAALHRWAANAKNEQGKGRKLDWDKAWVNWIERRHDERYGRSRTNGMGRNQPNDGLGRTARAALDVFGPDPGHPH